eukprot:2589295-Amphidinium_carterae.1
MVFRRSCTSALADVNAVCQRAHNFIAASMLEVKHLSQVAYNRISHAPKTSQTTNPDKENGESKNSR